jgi:PAS domain S-box-containing protein
MAFCQTVIDRLEPVARSDRSRDDQAGDEPAGTQASLGSYLGVHFMPAGGRDIGVLSVFDVGGRAFDSEDASALRDCAASLEESASELAVAQERLRHMLNTVSATICYWSRDLRCVFANESARNYFVGAPTAPVGKTMPELQGPVLFAANEPHIRKALAGEAQHFERSLTKADGSRAVVDVHYRPDIGEDGTVHGFYVVVNDITDIHAAREAALKLAAAKSDFLANMSHEVRTPLTGILGMTQWLLDTPLSGEQHEIATSLANSGEHLLAVVNDILDYSKIDSGQLSLESVAFDLEELVTQATVLIRPVAEEKGLSLVVDVSLEAQRRRGDPTRVRQILINLLNNAVKFTTTGRVSVHAFEAGSGDVLISVEDTGVGIPQEQLRHIFERFSQADESTTRRYGGSGLGLAICRRLVDLMGGEIQVTSTAGIGSRFSCRVPLPIALVSAESSASPEAPPPTDLTGLRVLVAEDTAVNQLLLRRMLTRLGCAVTIVSNGRSAVEAWISGTFDVVLMDCQMPEMDGMDATRRIRSEGRSGADVPIIALTAGVLHSDRERAMQAGMTDFLTKPLKPVHLEEALARAVRRTSERVT